MHRYHLVTVNTGIGVLEDYRYVYAYYSRIAVNAKKILWCTYDPIFDSHQFAIGDMDYIVVKNLSEEDTTLLILCNNYVKEIHLDDMSSKLLAVMNIET